MKSSFAIISHRFSVSLERPALSREHVHARVKADMFYAIICLLVIISGLNADVVNYLKEVSEKSDINRMENIDFIYMINLDFRPQKFERSTQQLAAYHIYPYRFLAVNGWKLTADEINKSFLLKSNRYSKEKI